MPIAKRFVIRGRPAAAEPRESLPVLVDRVRVAVRSLYPARPTRRLADEVLRSLAQYSTARSGGCLGVVNRYPFGK